jgi:hypothetical protein
MEQQLLKYVCVFQIVKTIIITIDFLYMQCCFQHFGIHIQKIWNQPNELKNTQK